MATSAVQTGSILGQSYTSGDTSSTVKPTGQQALANMDSFLKMFLTQLQHQDPTNPLESYELSAQLAQFSTVERLTQVNENLKNLQSYVSSLNNAQMVNLVGKQVVAQGNGVQVKSGTASTIDYKLDAPVEVTAKIYDKNAMLVRTIKFGAQQAGDHQIQWDGKNDQGQKVSDGNYTCEVSAVDANGDTSAVATTIKGQVCAVRFDGGNPLLVMDGPDGFTLPAGQVTEVMAAQDAAASAVSLNRLASSVLKRI